MDTLAENPVGREDRPRLLVVDDDPSILSQLSLALEGDFRVRTVADPAQAWELIHSERPEVVTLDLALDDRGLESGFSLLERCQVLDPFMKIVLVTGNDDEANARRAVQQGAADIFGKPVDVQELRVLLRRVLARGRWERQNAALLQSQGEERRLGSLLGQSPAMREVFRTIEKIAPVDISVLILGPGGTGKDSVAREIRRLSSRATRPWIAIRCGEIPPEALERELFGQERRSLNGSPEIRPGLFEQAQGGTVLLEEVAELPPPLQMRLLRLLRDQQIDRVGGRTPVELDVRVLAASSHDLEEEVRQGRLREDLHYRLAVVSLRLPALRQRGEDVLLLAQYFLDRYRAEFGRGALSFLPRARLALQQHDWPGNVRELEHRVQKAVLLAAGRQIDIADLELKRASEAEGLSLRAAREETERRMVIEALRATGGNISKAAGLLGISRPGLHELLLKQDIHAGEYRPPR